MNTQEILSVIEHIEDQRAAGYWVDETRYAELVAMLGDLHRTHT